MSDPSPSCDIFDTFCCIVACIINVYLLLENIISNFYFVFSQYNMGDSKCHHDEATLSQTEEKRAMSKVLEEYPAYITESRSNFFSLIIPHTEVISAISFHALLHTKF